MLHLRQLTVFGMVARLDGDPLLMQEIFKIMVLADYRHLSPIQP